MAQQPDFKNKIEDSSARESFDRDFESLKKAVAMQEFEIGAGSKMKQEIGADEEDRTVMPLSAHNQPLGVLVAEKAKAQNIPYAIVTSGHGAHGDISTPVAVFLKEKGIVRGVRGNYAGEERPGRTLCRYIRNGQIATFEEFKADSLAGSSRKFYLENPDSLINDYNITRQLKNSKPFIIKKFFKIPIRDQPIVNRYMSCPAHNYPGSFSEVQDNSSIASYYEK